MANAQIKLKLTADGIINSELSSAFNLGSFNPTSATDTMEGATPTTSSNKEELSNGKYMTKSLLAAKSVADSALNFAVNNVSRYTGNQRNQTIVNNAQQMFQTGFTFLLSPIWGVAQITTSVGTTIMNENFRKQQETLNLTNSRAKNGYTDTASIVNSRRH